MARDTPAVAGDTHGGIIGATLSVESFSLGDGVELRRTFAHLFATNMVAFARPTTTLHHPAPWKAARGGFAYDIEIEIRVAEGATLPASLSSQDAVWWIAALLRLSRFPYLSVPILSDQSFRDIPTSTVEPTLTPFETQGRILSASGSEPVITEADLDWLAHTWRVAGTLLDSSPKFSSAFKAFDSATLSGRSSSSLLALWGAIEQLFAPSAGELRFRVSALLASFLEPPGQQRLELYRHIMKLYNERSQAAHTAKDVSPEPLVLSYVLMRNALTRIINDGKVPSSSDLEELLFCVAPPA